jgi:hypothetical protein
LMAKVDAACKKGNSSVLMNASDPGWATSDFAIATLGIADKIDQVRMIEFACFAQYPAEYACREYFGFGQPKGFSPQLVRDNLIQEMWAPTLYRMADVLDVNIDEFKVLYETDSVNRDLDVAFGKVKAGTAAVVHFELQGLNRGRPFVVLEHVDTLLDNFSEAGAQWSKPTHPHSSYRIEVHGNPAYSVELQAHNTLFNSTPVLNCIPALVAAPPGLLHPLDIPRYYGRNVTARTGPWP